jgi:hypothetical protein
MREESSCPADETKWDQGKDETQIQSEEDINTTF